MNTEKVNSRRPALAGEASVSALLGRLVRHAAGSVVNVRAEGRAARLSVTTAERAARELRRRGLFAWEVRVGGRRDVPRGDPPEARLLARLAAHPHGATVNVGELGAAAGIPASSARKIVARLASEGRFPWTVRSRPARREEADPTLTDRFRALHSGGLSCLEIARRLALNPATAAAMRRRLGLAKNPRRGPAKPRVPAPAPVAPSLAEREAESRIGWRGRADEELSKVRAMGAAYEEDDRDPLEGPWRAPERRGATGRPESADAVGALLAAWWRGPWARLKAAGLLKGLVGERTDQPFTEDAACSS